MEMRTRRWFLRGAIGSVVGATVTVILFRRSRITPASRAGLFRMGKTPEQILESIERSGKPFYHAPGRFYLVAYDTSRSAASEYVRAGVAAGGLMALYQRCTHLGCRVPFCETSQWFECPCHPSKYDKAGEYRAGPAPRGLDRFPIRIEDGEVVVDTGKVVAGPPRGTDTIHQPPAGAFCVDTGYRYPG